LFEEVGERIFRFSVIGALLNSVLVAALAGTGYPVENLRSPLYLPYTKIYPLTYNLVNSIPSFGTMLEIAVALATGVLEFMFTMLFGVFSFFLTIADLLPGEVQFLKPAILLVGGILQLFGWWYMVNYIITKIRSLLGVTTYLSS
jgi:hypothetical protein